MQALPPLLSVHGLRGHRALRGLSLCVQPGELVCLAGDCADDIRLALRIIAGRAFSSGGEVYFKGRKITDDWLSPKKLCYVSDRPGLFPAGRQDRELLFGLGLNNSNLCPDDRQKSLRILRALRLRPELLVIDSAADSLAPMIRSKLFETLREAARSGTGILYATTQAQDMIGISDRLVLMVKGRSVREGSPEDLYHHPGSATEALLTGSCLLWNGQVAAVKGDNLLFSSQGLSIPCKSGLWHTPGERVTLCLRPEWLHWGKENDGGFSPSLQAKLLKSDPVPGAHRLAFELSNGIRFSLERADLPASLRKPGEHYLMWWDMDKALLLPPEDEDLS